MVRVVLVITVLAAIALFSIQNAAPIAVSFLFWNFTASLAVVLFLTMIIGIITGATVYSLLRKKSK